MEFDHICERYSQALKVIEKLEADLKDDTYLDKTISEIQADGFLGNEIQRFKLFVVKSEIESFCNRNYDHERLQDYTFRLCGALCTKLPTQWIPKCIGFLKRLKKWNLSQATFDLLSLTLILGAPDGDFLGLTWKSIVARILLCQIESKSHFWVRSAKNLLSVFLLNVLSSSVEEPIVERISKVIRDMIRCQNQFCLEFINEAIGRMSTHDLERFEKMFPQVEQLLHFDTQIQLKALKSGPAAAMEVLRSNVANVPQKTWIKALATQDLKNFGEETHQICLGLAKSDHKVISNLVLLKWPQLSDSLCTIIINDYLQSFLIAKDGPTRQLTVAEDLKLFKSCLSNLKVLMPQVEEISQDNAMILIQLSMVTDGVSRSLVLTLLADFLKREMIPSCNTLEFWTSHLWHLMRHDDWETKDALLGLFSTKELKWALKEVPKFMLDAFFMSMSHESSFVRRAALKFLGKLWQIQPNCILNVHEKIEDIFISETEAVVRRQVIQFVSENLNPDDLKTTSFVLKASQDLDWEVKSHCFHFWSSNFETKLQKCSDLSEFIHTLMVCQTLDGIEVLSKDYEKELQNGVLRWISLMQQRIVEKYNIGNSDCEHLKIIFDELISKKLAEHEEYCQNHFGLLSVLDDIIQLNANSSSIDTIDCF